MKIILQPHLKIRLNQRKISPSFPKKILSKPDFNCFDSQTNHLIAVKKLEYNEKLRLMVVAYDIMGSEIQVITVHPIAEQEIDNKLRRGRWIKDEKT